MLYDLSPPLTSKLPVWPEDTPLERHELLHIERGDAITASAVFTTVHVGSHVDAPCHVGRHALPIDQCDLETFMGRCQVVRVAAPPKTVLLPMHLHQAAQAPRILFATGTYPGDGRFHEDFAALSPALIEHLHGQGIRLVGIDTPSVDLFDAPDLPTHHACLRHGVAILEGLVLDGVPEGVYELIALPLKLVGFDASPVRAVLRTLT